jgi:hypothetical protein
LHAGYGRRILDLFERLLDADLIRSAAKPPLTPLAAELFEGSVSATHMI